MNNSVSFYRCWRWRWWRRCRREGGLLPATALDRRTTEEKTVCELDSCPEHDDGGACHSIAYFILNTIQKRNILHIMKNDRMCCICTRFYRHEHRRPLSSGFVRLGHHHHRPSCSVFLWWWMIYSVYEVSSAMTTESVVEHTWIEVTY